MAWDPEGENKTATGQLEYLKNFVKGLLILILCFGVLCNYFSSQTPPQTSLSKTDSYIAQFDAKELRLTKAKEDAYRLRNKIFVWKGGFYAGLAGLGLIALGFAGGPIFGVAGAALATGGGVANGVAEYLVDGDEEKIKALEKEFIDAGQPLHNILESMKGMSKELEKQLKDQNEDLKIEDVQNSLRKILKLISKVFKRTWNEMAELISDFRKIKYELLEFKKAADKLKYMKKNPSKYWNLTKTQSHWSIWDFLATMPDFFKYR